MVSRFARGIALVAVAGGLSACEMTKSSNPLSPTVAGPIPGVQITQPKLLEPAGGTRIAVDKQPIMLMIENASSNGVRPLSYAFEVATDASFTNKVFARNGVQPGDSGRTTLRLPDPLATERTYYWRAKAEDGANTGTPAAPSNFQVFTPIVINAPGLVSPLNGITTDGIHPNFVIANATRSGPVGAISYLIELSDTGSFENKIASWTVAEQPNQTTTPVPQDLAYSHTYFWHARAFDPGNAGPFSQTFAFTTPLQPVAAPPPPVGGPAPGDAINLATAAVYNSPPDIASWPATGRITNLSMSGASGLSFEFTTKQSWPDVVPPGWDGPLQYTVWAVVNINGRWYTSGFIQMWRGRASTGAPILSDFAANWAYDARWGPMAGYHPHAGEQMGFFLSAGNARGFSGVSSVRERTNVVMVNLPPGDNGSFAFGLAKTR